MPQEYSTRTPGSPAPSPSSFGSEPMRLDQPNFVAQTNVAKAPDVFGALQEILGLGAKVGIQATELRTQAIKNVITLENAKQEGVDRLERKTEKAEVKARKALQVAGLIEIQKETDPEKQASLRAGFEKKAEDSYAAGAVDEAGMYTTLFDASEVAESKAQARIDKKKSTLEELENAAARSILTNDRGPISTYTSLRDELGLMGLQRSATDRSLDTTIPESSRNAHAQIAKEANTALDQLQRDATGEAAATENAELKLAYTTRQAVGDAMEGPVVEILSNLVKAGNQFKDVSDESLASAVFDYLVKGIADTEVGAILATADPKSPEALAASREVRQQAGIVVKALASQRNDNAKKQLYNERLTTATAIISTGDPDAIQRSIDFVLGEDLNLSPTQRDAIHSKSGTAYVDAVMAETPDNPAAAALKAATTMLQKKTLPLAMREAAASRLEEVMRASDASWAVTRAASVVEGTPEERHPVTGRVTKKAVPDSNFGFAEMADSRDDFVDQYLMKTFGLTTAAVREDPMLGELLGSSINRKVMEYDADVTRRNTAQGRARSAARRMSGSGNKGDASDGFDQTELGQHILGNTLKELSAPEIGAMIDHDLIDGYTKNTALPPRVQDVLEHFEDKHNQRFGLEFWIRYKPGENAAVDALLLGSKPEMRNSRSAAYFMAFLKNDPNMGEEQRADAVIEFNNNMIASSSGQMSSSSLNDEAVYKKLEIDTVVEKLTQGQGTEWRLWFMPDFWNHSQSEAFVSMDEADRATVLSIAQSAASAPARFRENLMAYMMQQQGYGMYQMTDGNYNLLNTSRGRSLSNDPDGNPVPGTFGLPAPAVVASEHYQKFLQSLLPDISTALGKRKDVSGYDLDAFQPGDLHSVGIAPTDSDLREGRCGLFVLNGAGKRIDLTAYELAITTDHWTKWKKANPAVPTYNPSPRFNITP